MCNFLKFSDNQKGSNVPHVKITCMYSTVSFRSQYFHDLLQVETQFDSRRNTNTESRRKSTLPTTMCTYNLKYASKLSKPIKKSNYAKNDLDMHQVSEQLILLRFLVFYLLYTEYDVSAPCYYHCSFLSLGHNKKRNYSKIFGNYRKFHIIAFT